MYRYRKITLCLLAVSLLFCAAFSAQAQIILDEDGLPTQETVLASLWEADITQIRLALTEGLVTSSQLTAYYLERIAAYNDVYNCFITLCDDAMEQAAQRDEEIAAGVTDKCLLGVPIVVKDNIDYAGYHTTNGYRKNSSQIAYSNAQIVEYMLQQGAVIIGKTNMSAGAGDHKASYSEAAGETKNAYNPQLSSAGSSGGSAAAVSLNFATVGLGTDTNSSLRLPAAYNGCVSMRVTWNTLSREGIRTLNSNKDVPGVITRTVMDQAICLDVLSGGQTQYAQNLNDQVLSGLRIGILTEFSGPNAWGRNGTNIDPEITQAFEQAVEELRQCGAEVVEVSIPNVFYLAEATYSGGKYSIDSMYQVVEQAMMEAEVSALIFPSYLSAPVRTGYDDEGTYWYTYQQTLLNNTSKFSSCAGLPEIVVPIGQHSLGAGIGMEIAGLKNEEQLLLDIAYSYTTRYDHRPETDNAPDLYEAYYQGNIYELLEAVELAQQPVETVEPTVPETTQPQVQQAVETVPASGVQPWAILTLVFTGLGSVSAILIIRKKRRNITASV